MKLFYTLKNAKNNFFGTLKLLVANDNSNVETKQIVLFNIN